MKRIAEHAAITGLAAFCTAMFTGMEATHAGWVTLGGIASGAAWQGLRAAFGEAGTEIGGGS